MRPNILDRVADRLERGWCQGEYAKGRNGLYASADSPDAVAWCWEGALQAEGVWETWDRRPLKRAMEKAIETACIIDWNDAKGRTQSEVVAATRKAAEILG